VTQAKGAPDGGIELAEAIGALRDALLQARAEGADSPIRLPVTSMTVELHVAATRTADAKAGFTVPFVDIGVGGSAGWQRGATNTVTVVFGGPVDRNDNPVDIGQASDKPMG
jgi:hypothetical protein